MFNKKNIIIYSIIAVVVILAIVLIVVFSQKDKNKNMNVVEEKPVQEELTERNAKAKIDNKLFKNVQEAVDSVVDGGTDTKIEIINDVNENVEISANKNIVFELNNHKFRNQDRSKPTISVKGNLTINNGDISGDLNTVNPTIYVYANAKLKLSNTNVTRNSDDGISAETVSVQGLLDIDSGKISSTNSNAIYTYTDRYVEVDISGTAEISAVDHAAISNRNQVKVNISGGKVYSESNDGINNQYGGQVVISAGNISSKSGKPVNNYGTFEIDGTAEISSNAEPTIYNQSGASLKMTSGYVHSVSGITILNQNNATCEVVGGRVISETGNSVNNSGTLRIGNDADIMSNGENSPTVYNNNGGKIEVLGGKISNTSNNYDIFNNGGSVKDDQKLVVKKNYN